jgi:uncharacterized membrane protein
MIKVENSVVINRPVDEVFEFVSNIENLPQWAGPVLEAKQTSDGPIGVGTTQTQVAQFLGRRIETSHEVTEYEPNKKLSTKTTSGPLPMEVHYILEPAEEGTRVSLVGNVDAGGFFKLAEPIVGRMLNRQTASDAANLKDLLEAQAEAST